MWDVQDLQIEQLLIQLIFDRNVLFRFILFLYKSIPLQHFTDVRLKYATLFFFAIKLTFNQAMFLNIQVNSYLYDKWISAYTFAITYLV